MISQRCLHIMKIITQCIVLFWQIFIFFSGMNLDTELGYRIYVRINETNDSRLKQLLSEFNILQNLDLSLDHSIISFLVISHGLYLLISSTILITGFWGFPPFWRTNSNFCPLVQRIETSIFLFFLKHKWKKYLWPTKSEKSLYNTCSM